MPSVSTVLHDATSLTEQERIEIIQKLSETVTDHISDEWTDELFRRLEDADSGKGELIDGDTARATIRKAVGLA